MTNRNIILRSQKEVMEFVDIVIQYPYSVEVTLGRETMDAKSVLGMLALGFNRVMNMNIQSESAEDLLEAVSKFVCTQFGQAV
ncbi:MAG: HPr family phosphocarrier protein [Lachnospiraceae bacterium]|nr:HPr family phosphocarrier protein [Lachnospiraceae bacterium]MDE7274180.1 HPr family phosphocarrier protein [Lachnospiraceae bacterium]